MAQPISSWTHARENSCLIPGHEVLMKRSHESLGLRSLLIDPCSELARLILVAVHPMAQLGEPMLSSADDN